MARSSMLAALDLTMAVVVVITMIMASLVATTTAASSQLSHHSYRYEVAKEYVIDLDMDPHDRWSHVAADFQGLAGLVNDYIQDSLNLTTTELDLLIEIADRLDFIYGEELAAEIQGLSKSSGIDLGVLVSLNLAYELSAFAKVNATPEYEQSSYGGIACSSVVMSNSEGTIHQGRNLDWNIPDSLRNLSISCNFTKGGSYLYSGACIVGYVGILTGFKSGKFGVSLNARTEGGLLEDVFVALLKGSLQPSTLLRRVMETAESYDEAVHQLDSAPVVSPVYYIVGGLDDDQGAVVTRDRLSTKDLWLLDTKDKDQWWLFETNYDHWKPVPANDDRRDRGINAILALGKENVDTDAVFQVLSTPLVLNQHTSMTVVMCPSTGYFKTYIVYVDY